MHSLIPTSIVPSPEFEDLSQRAVSNEFRELLEAGARLHVVGGARRNPEQLLAAGYTPKHRVDLFDTRFYLTNVRQNPELRFCIAYVVQKRARSTHVHTRLFYKDLSLVWRSASHYSRVDGGLWVGRGDVTPIVVDSEDLVESMESTTDLPHELQPALEALLRRGRRPHVIGLVLQVRARKPGRALPRVHASARRRAREPRKSHSPRALVGRFRRANDPSSLEFSRGFEPDFENGVL